MEQVIAAFPDGLGVFPLAVPRGQAVFQEAAHRIAVHRATIGVAHVEMGIERDQPDLGERQAEGVGQLLFGGMAAMLLFKLMNRRHNAAQAVEAVRSAQHEGYENITVDLIFGVPGFGDDTLRRSLIDARAEQARAAAVQVAGNPGGAYNPQNYARDFKGPVSARTALASSLNTPAVRALELVTPNRLRERLFNLGQWAVINQVDDVGLNSSRWQIQTGVRYTFN